MSVEQSRSERSRTLWQTNGFRQKVVFRITEACGRVDHRKRHAEKMQLAWQNPTTRSNMINGMIGHEVSQQTRDKIRKAKLGAPRTEETKRKISQEMGGTKIIGTPLVMRGASVEEIIQLTSLTRNQVEGLISHLRNNGVVKKPTKEETNLAKRKAHLGKPSRSHERVYSLDQARSLLFARKLVAAGLFGDDLSNWNQLHRIYAEHGRQLPDFANSLRLEVFIEAYSRSKKGDATLLNRYSQLGETVDDNWFAASLVLEEQFIRDRLSCNLSRPLDDWSPETQAVIAAIDEVKAPIAVRKAFFSYWAHFAVGDGVAETTSTQLGIPVDEFVHDLRMVRFMEMDRDEWKAFETIMDEHNLTEDQFARFKLCRPKKKEA